MGKKIVFFDIDGTLLDENKELPSSTVEAVQALKETGVYVQLRREGRRLCFPIYGRS